MAGGQLDNIRILEENVRKHKAAVPGGRYGTGTQPYRMVGAVCAGDGGSLDGRSINGIGHPAAHLAPAQVAGRGCVGCYCQSQADGGTVCPRGAAWDGLRGTRSRCTADCDHQQDK